MPVEDAGAVLKRKGAVDVWVVWAICFSVNLLVVLLALVLSAGGMATTNGSRIPVMFGLSMLVVAALGWFSWRCMKKERYGFGIGATFLAVPGLVLFWNAFGALAA